MNIFGLFEKRVADALDGWPRPADPGRARCQPRRRRTAARPLPWRSRHQRRDGAGEGSAHEAARACGDSSSPIWPRPARREGRGRRARASSISSSQPSGPARGPAGGRRRRHGFGRQPGRARARRSTSNIVSANPTGPMHVGHGRGAVFGDALASLLAFAGHEVTPRILHQRRRRPGRRPRALGLPALPRGAGRGRSARSRRGSIPATI